MANKRKQTENETSSSKRSKYGLEKYDKLLVSEELTDRINADLDEYNSIIANGNLHDALKYLRSIFPQSFDLLPVVIFQHQIYSLIKNKTLVDREIESLKSKNLIYVFKSESNKFSEDDLSICFVDDYNSYVNRVLLDEFESIKKIISNFDKDKLKCLVEKFSNVILKEMKELSISQLDLKTKFLLKEPEITALVQTGLLTIKDMSTYWYFYKF
jgi:serine/threonine-protein kinase 19